MTNAAAGPTEIRVRRAGRSDLPRLRDILNHEILTSTASWTTAPKSPDGMAAWYDARLAAGFPVLVAESAKGEVVGYASYGPFRAGEGYAGTVEHSVYVDAGHRRAGIAGRLMAELIAIARAAGLGVMVGGVSGEATASLTFHERLGFREVGRIPGAGRKFGRPLDLVFMALTL